MLFDVVEDFRPEVGSLRSRYSRRQQARVHHFQQILIAEGIVGRLDLNRRLPRVLECVADLLQLLIGHSQRIRINHLAAQVVQRIQGPEALPGNDNQFYIRYERSGECHMLLAFGGDDHTGGDQVS